VGVRRIRVVQSCDQLRGCGGKEKARVSGEAFDLARPCRVGGQVSPDIGVGSGPVALSAWPYWDLREEHISDNLLIGDLIAAVE
jgi:hypothetical protein